MRAIWSGSISFGLVNIPIKLYGATKDEGISFDLIHNPDLSKIRYARICRSEEREVPYDEISKGYEYEPNRYVILNDEDFERANVRKAKTIAILNFVKAEEIDPVYFEKPYYLEPDRDSDQAYSLLLEALRHSGKVGVGKYVLRNREKLVILRPYEDIIILEQLRFRSEIKAERPHVKKVLISNEEKNIALALINQLSKKFDPDNYWDTYSNELRRVIGEKIAGRVPAIKGEIPKPTPVPDLMAILKKSLEQEKSKTK